MAPTIENLNARERFLTSGWHRKLAIEVSQEPPAKVDHFTLSASFPRTFKIGECKVISDQEVAFQVQLYWRDDQTTEQKEVAATMVKENGAWLLSDVSLKEN